MTSFYLFDGLGSTTQLASSTGSVTDSYLYDSFGNILLTSGTTTNWFRFVSKFGYYFSPDLSNYYVRARYLDNVTGTFLSRDPSGHISMYAYALNNPANSIDPSGLDCRLGERLTCLLTVGFTACLQGSRLAEAALAAAIASGLPGAHNGPQDAFRHCYWSCRMTQVLGRGPAGSIGTIHEECEGGPPGESCMDNFNNFEGQKCGSNAQADCNKCCMDKINNGGLMKSPCTPGKRGPSYYCTGHPYGYY